MGSPRRFRRIGPIISQSPSQSVGRLREGVVTIWRRAGAGCLGREQAGGGRRESEGTRVRGLYAGA